MENGAFFVRRAVDEDIPQIKEVSREAFRMYAEGAGITAFVKPLEESYEDLKRELSSKLVYVAMSGDRVIGSVRIELLGEDTAYLSRFGVREEFQSKGIGRLMIKTIDKEMERLGIIRLYLHTASRMLSLVRFYYGMGFYIESTSRDKGYIRALLCKEYEQQIAVSFAEDYRQAGYESLAVI